MTSAQRAVLEADKEARHSKLSVLRADKERRDADAAARVADEEVPTRPVSHTGRKVGKPHGGVGHGGKSAERGAIVAAAATGGGGGGGGGSAARGGGAQEVPHRSVPGSAGNAHPLKPTGGPALRAGYPARHGSAKHCSNSSLGGQAGPATACRQGHRRGVAQ